MYHLLTMLRIQTMIWLSGRFADWRSFGNPCARNRESEGEQYVHIVRFEQSSGPAYGVLEDGVVYEAQGDPYGDGVLSRGTSVGPVDDVTLLTPVTPSKIIAIGLNYLDHITEDAPDFEKPANPIVFLKPPSSLVGHGADIIMPAGPDQVEAEAELAVVFGRQARHVKANQIDDYILGLTCANDVSARDYQFKDGQWVRAKGFDTFTPVGPSIVTGLKSDKLAISCRLNGKIAQDASTEMLLFNVPYLIEFVSRVMTIEPGDILLTGTPARPPRIQAGDVVEVEIEGIGILKNAVVAEEPLN